MGRDKAALTLGGRTFLDIIRETAAPHGAVRVIDRDVVPSIGPLAGIITGFMQSTARHVLFLSCDMPFVDGAVLERMIKTFIRHRRAVFAVEEGASEGFPFILPRASLGTVREQLDAGQLSLKALAKKLRARRVGFPANGPLSNINTPEEYAAAVARFERQTAVLCVEGLAIRRGRVRLIDDFTWKVRRGEHWVILGANGSGKTSLLSALLGYLTPTAGEVRMLGQVYGDSDWRALRSRIGLVSSSIRQLIPEAEPAWITVASGRYAMIDFWGTPNRADRRAAFAILERIECCHLADRDWTYLSQGERQRILIGRALIARPALLILDEPCAGLDPAAREHFLQFLVRLGQEPGGPSLVLVTHHVEEIMPVFTHALLLAGGRSLAQGPVRATLDSKRLTAAFGASVRLHRAGGRYRLTVEPNRKVIL